MIMPYENDEKYRLIAQCLDLLRVTIIIIILVSAIAIMVLK